VYSGLREGTELLEIHSTDSGGTWSEPTTVSQVYGDDHLLAGIQLFVDRQGRVHAAWSVPLASSALGEEVYYARLEADLEQWSEPVLLAAREGNDYAADYPAIIGYRDELIVMYMDGVVPGGVPPTQWMRRSRDGGQTWTDPVRPFPHVGGHGAAALLVDSNEVLHILVGNRIGDPPIGGMWHGVWLGERWSELELITDQVAIVSGSPYVDESASRPRAIVSQGNVLLGTWWHDSRGQPPAAYSYVVLDAPELPVVPLPAPPTTPTSTATLSQTVLQLIPVPSPRAASAIQSTGSSEESPSSNAAGPVALAIVPVALLITIVIIAQRLRY
jgi:hypothetical protein